MSTEMPATPEQQQPWGAQPAPRDPQRQRWSGKKTAAAVAIAVAIAAGGGAAIYAATSNDSGARGGPGGGGPGGFGGPGGYGNFGGPGGAQNGGGFGGRGMFGPAALTQALHGEFVISDGSTELLQNGKVTAVSSTSISVTSTDGYAKTYTIDGSTRKEGDIKTGDTVLVIAKQGGAALTIDEPTANQGQNGTAPDRRGQQQPPTSR
jgi:hypothetical protein